MATGNYPEGAACPVPINRMIKAYPARLGCALVAGDHLLHGLLVDINYASARILFDAGAAVGVLRLDQRARLRTRIATTRRLLCDMPCRVAWLSGREAGIEFEEHLGVGIKELQSALEPGLRVA